MNRTRNNPLADDLVRPLLHTSVWFYGAVLVAATMLLLFSGLDVVTAFTAVVASINNTGPGLGQVGPAANYQGLTDFQTWVCTVTMLLGRLELFSILVLFTGSFWRK